MDSQPVGLSACAAEVTRLLVVGAGGSMGTRRLRNLTHLGGQELAGMEPNAERARKVEAEFGIPVFADLASALDWGPDALVISTPPDRHTEYALAAVQRGLHFFTEASVVDDGMEDLVSAARAGTRVAAPSCTLRFHPSVRELKKLLDAGAIGRPLAFTHHTGQYLPDWHPWEDYRTFYVARRETGAAREIVPFELVWQTYLFGRPSLISAFVTKVSDLDADIDDIYSCLLRFDSGVQGAVVVDAIARPAIRFARILGSDGTLEWDWTRKVVREWNAAHRDWVEHPEPVAVEGRGGKWVAENMYIDEMRAYLDAIAGTSSWPYSLEEDLMNLRVLQALERSSRDARHVALPGD